MLSAFVLHKERALLSAELLQVPAEGALGEQARSSVAALASQQDVGHPVPQGPYSVGPVPPRHQRPS